MKAFLCLELSDFTSIGIVSKVNTLAIQQTGSVGSVRRLVS